jgi:tetratricopeptide (TPR) repeat protein
MKFNNINNPIKTKKIFNLEAEKLVRKASDTFLYLKDYNKALSLVEKVLSFDPAHTKAHLLKGDILLCLDNYKEALISYENGIFSNPKCAQAYGSKAGVLDMMNRQEEALECCEKAFKFLNYNDKQLILSLYDQKISLLTALKKYRKAQQTLSEAVINLSDEDGAYLMSCYGSFIEDNERKNVGNLVLQLVY